MNFSIICNDLSETEKLAEKFANNVRDIGAFVSLYGDVGAGKTAFTKLVCKYLNVKEIYKKPIFHQLPKK